MAIKRLLKALPLILLLLPASGCWDAIDINERVLLTAVVVDKTDTGYAFYAEIPQGMEGQQPPVILRSEGRTLAEARAGLDRASESPVFLGTVYAALITDKLAEYGAEEYFLRLRYLNDYRMTLAVAVVEGDPETLLKDRPEQSPTVGMAIAGTMENLIHMGELYNIQLIDVLESLASPYRHYVLPTFALVEREPTFTGFTVFSGNRKTGIIPAEESRPMVIMRAKKPAFELVVPYGDRYASVEVRLAKRKVRPSYDGSRPSFSVELAFVAEIMYPVENEPVTNLDQRVIEATLKAMLERDFNSLFDKSRHEYDFDVYELRRPFRIAYPQHYKRMDWAGEYRNAQADFKIEVRLDESERHILNPQDK